MKKENNKCRFKNEKGVSAIEFALVLLFILFPLIVGVIDFGHLFKHKQVLDNAAREGARAAVKGDDFNSISNIIKTYYINEIPEQDQFLPLDIKLAYKPSRVAGAEVTVTVTETFQFLIIPGSLFPNIDQLTATAIMSYQ
jgi:Flp pilus assembly protein TadG